MLVTLATLNHYSEVSKLWNYVIMKNVEIQLYVSCKQNFTKQFCSYRALLWDSLFQSYTVNITLFVTVQKYWGCVAPQLWENITNLFSLNNITLKTFCCRIHCFKVTTKNTNASHTYNTKPLSWSFKVV